MLAPSRCFRTDFLRLLALQAGATLLALSSLVPNTSFAATLPSTGGASALAHYAGDQVQTTGTDVDVWDNQGTGGAVLNAAVVTNKPELVANVVNGQSVVRFGGNALDEHLRTGEVGATSSQPLTVYHVGLVRSVSNNPYWYDSNDSGNRVAYLHRSGGNPNEPDQYAGTEVSGGGTAPTNSFNIWSVTYDSPGGSVMRLNGSTYLATGNVGSNGFRGFTIGARYTNVQEIDGDLAELALVPGAVNTAGRQILENYFSAKYDVSLSAGDVYAGDGNAEGDYDFDVFGIGQTDVSNTVTTSSLAGLTIEDLGGSLGDGDFVMAGHKTASNSLTSANVPAGEQRWQRVWYIDQTGSVDTTLTFDWSDSGLIAPFDPDFDTLYLLKR